MHCQRGVGANGGVGVGAVIIIGDSISLSAVHLTEDLTGNLTGAFALQYERVINSCDICDCEEHYKARTMV